MANYNLSARKKEGYNFNDDRRSKLYNYIAARDSEKETEKPQAQPTVNEEKEADFLTRLLATGGDLLGNVVTGAAKGVEGIVDFGIGTVGAIGGLFDEGFRDDAQKAIEYDATHEWLGQHIDRWTEDSFTNDSEIGQIVESVASGVGQMLPTVAITFATGGLAGAAGASASAATAAGQTAGLVSMGVSAAGSGTEEAYKEGADYYKGLGYGVVSGATEVATEKLFGGLTKGLTGKGVLDFGGEVADQGIKRILKGAAEEGAEEVISHYASPLAKTIYKGKDALKEYTDPEFHKEGGKAFLAGAGTGMVYGGTVGKAVNRAQGVNDDISAAVEANEGIREKLITAQDNGSLTAEAERDAAESRIKNLQSIEKTLQKADEETRKTYIKNYQLDNTFNEDGSLKPEIVVQENAKIEGRQTITNSAEGENGTAEQLDGRYYSVDLRGKEQTVREDLAAMSSESEVIKPFTGELSENAQKNFTKMKKALTTLNKHRGESVSFVIVDANNKFNGAERRGDTIYIAADALERDAAASYFDEESREANYAGTMLHEYGHTTEGTEEHAALNSFLAEDKELYAGAVDRVLGQEYGITDEEIRKITEKRRAGGQLTNEEQKKFDTFYSEVGATMSEQLLGNERVIRKLVREGDPLVDRVISWAENVKKTLSGKGEKFTLAEKRRMDKALKLYLKAAETAGNRDLVKRILALREEDEDDAILTDESYTDKNTENQPSNDHKTENMKVSDTKFSKKDEARYTEYDKPITLRDVEVLRSIDGKSINTFDTKEIELTQKWAHKFYKELGVKSPFFRAWFGEWRAYDKSERKIVSVPTIDISQATLANGNYSIKDTGWEVYAGKTLNDDTRHHSGGNRINVKALSTIEKILSNAVLLDTVISNPDKNKKSPNTAFLHKLYTLIEYDGKTYIAKITVEEYYNQGKNNISRKAYNLKAIKIEPAGGQFRINNSSSSVPVTDSIYSISDLYEFVKTYDKDFSPAPTVSKVVLNEDGTPKVFYHGTNTKFTIFESGHKRTRGRLNFGEGYYFAADKSYAENYIEKDGRIIEAYISLKKPYFVVGNQFTEWEISDIRSKLPSEDGSRLNYDNINSYLKKLRYDGVVGLDYSGTTKTVKSVVAFDSAQIKSATDNIGTFSKYDNDIRYSYKAPAESKVYKQIAEWEKLKVYEKADAEKMLYTILSDVMTFSEDQAAVMTLEGRKDAEQLLWAELNKAQSEKEMKEGAEKVADFLISRSVVKSWLNDPYEAEKINAAEEALSNLKPYLHNLDLSRLKGEIKHKYDTKAKSVMLMWGTRRSGHGVDQIISELNSEMKGYGFPVDANANEAELFFAIHEGYTKARKELNAAYENYRDRTLTAEERDKLKAEISAKILDIYKTAGRESVLANATRIFKAELWKADQRVEYMKQYSVLVAKVDAFKQLTMGKFVNANTYHPDLFNGSVEQLKRIVRGGMISVKSTRDAVGKLAQWYRPDNPVVGEANYDASISSKMGQVADGGLSNYAGKKIDIKDLLEPYMHRIDLSGIKDQLREIYGEEMRSILATWNIKEGLEPVSLEEISSVLSKEGLDVYGDDFELFCQMESMYRSGVGPFSAEDLKNLSDIVAYFTKFVKNFNKVWNGKRYVEAEPIAKKHIQTIRENTKIKLGAFDSLMFGRYGSTFFRPETLARRLDMYGEGFYTDTLHEFRQGLIQANDYEHQMMEVVAEFDKKHKHYFSELAKRRIEFRGNKIPADIAMSLYMTSKRRQAQAGLAQSGFKYNDGKDTVDVQGYMPQKTPGGVEIGAERMQKLLWDEFSTEDREFIKIAESLFNGMCKQLKHDTDMSTKGYSNTVDGYYYPIKRAFVAKSVDSDFEDLMGRASNKSFNKDTVIGAKGVLCIMPMTEVLGRHVRGVAQYASLATVVRNYDTLYNLDIGENANDPTSIAREGEKLWKEGGDYYKKLLADMQGIGEKQSAFLSVIRGSYATYQLGGNPKTWVTQLSSFFASTSMLRYDSVMKGMGINGADVDEYCVLAKLRNANNDAILAQANANKPGLLKKRTKIGEMSRKVSDTLMAPIGVVDRFVITKLFGACQAEIEARGGAKVGTKENKTEAGKLLEDVIIHTQQNSLATDRSAAMRSGELVKSLTMFSADGMNVFGQVVDSMGEVTVLKARLRNATDSKEKAALTEKLKAAEKKAVASVSSLVTSAVFMAMISLLFNFLYHRIDEEDDAGDIAGDIAANFVGNMLGGLPVIRDIYSYLSDGYEVQNYMYSVLNDTLDAASSAIDLAISAFFKDSYDSREAARTVRKVVYSGGQLLGIPTRNLYNVTYSILGFIPSVKYGIDNMFYEQAYSSDLKKAVEAGDEGAIATITGIMTGERVGDIKDDKVRAELNDLTLKGYSVLPKAIADSVTVGEEKIELTGKQKRQFKEIYSIANDSVTELMALKQYKNATDEIKAKAIKMIYDIYYQLAMDDVVGGTEASKNVLFAEAISVEKLAIIIATCRSIEADKNKKGVTISGSKKKKIEKYIQSLNLTAVQKYMIMGYLGYKNTNGEASVKSYIGKLNLTKEEKAELLKYSGYN